MDRPACMCIDPSWIANFSLTVSQASASSSWAASTTAARKPSEGLAQSSLRGLLLIEDSTCCLNKSVLTYSSPLPLSCRYYNDGKLLYS